MGMQWHDFVGLAGVAFVVGAFFLLQADKLGAHSIGYQLANLFGALFILLSLYYAPNLSAILLQLVWIAISLFGLVRGFRLRRARHAEARARPPA
ncbi:CBU_0592 family membrane protein [Alkalisalibacterium limincola]|nr:hypothetical protein [Alkalisalibacterium limincola]